MNFNQSYNCGSNYGDHVIYNDCDDTIINNNINNNNNSNSNSISNSIDNECNYSETVECVDSQIEEEEEEDTSNNKNYQGFVYKSRDSYIISNESYFNDQQQLEDNNEDSIDYYEKDYHQYYYHPNYKKLSVTPSPPLPLSPQLTVHNTNNIIKQQPYHHHDTNNTNNNENENETNDNNTDNLLINDNEINNNILSNERLNIYKEINSNNNNNLNKKRKLIVSITKKLILLSYIIMGILIFSSVNSVEKFITQKIYNGFDFTKDSPSNNQHHIQLNQNNQKHQYINSKFDIGSLVSEYEKYNLDGDFDNSISTLNRILSISSRFCSVNQRLAQLLSIKGQYDNSEKMYLSALDCERWLNLEYIVELSNFYNNLNRYRESISLINRASLFFPNNSKLEYTFSQTRSLMNSNNVENYDNSNNIFYSPIIH